MKTPAAPRHFWILKLVLMSEDECSSFQVLSLRQSTNTDVKVKLPPSKRPLALSFSDGTADKAMKESVVQGAVQP